MTLLAVAVLGGCLGLSYAAFCRWRLRLLRRAIQEGRPCGPLWLRQLGASFMGTCARLNGVRLVSEGGEGLEAPPKQYIYVWHPHGFVSYVPAHLMGEKAVGGAPHKKEWFGTCIPALFKLPVIGEIFTVTNARPVDRRTVETILGKGGSLAIQPGGVKEQAATREDQEQAFFPAGLGFVKLAIKYGVPLMPVYIFGENQLYKRVRGMDWLTAAIKKLTGLTFPIVWAKWNMPQAGFFPRATDIHIRWGSPVDAGAAEEDPSAERVQEVFDRYLAELQRVFDANAKECLPRAVAEKGLRVVKLADGRASAGSSSSSKGKRS